MAKAIARTFNQQPARHPRGLRHRGVLPTVKRGMRKVRIRTRRATVTLGELVVAAFDTVGSEVKDVTRLLGSKEISRAIHKRIVVV